MRSTTMPTLLLLQISTAWVINTMTVGGRKKRRNIESASGTTYQNK